MVVVGVPGAVLMAAFMTIIQTDVHDAFRGRVFSAAIVIQSATMLAGTALAATLTDRLGVITMLTGQGAGYVLGGLCLAMLTRRGASAAGTPVEEPADAVLVD